MYVLKSLENLYELLANGDFENEKSHVCTKYNSNTVVSLYGSPLENGSMGAVLVSSDDTRHYTSFSEAFRDLAQFLFHVSELDETIKSNYQIKW